MTTTRSYKVAADRREPPSVRITALAQALRNIALNAPMNPGTRNRLHAIARTMEDVFVEVIESGEPIKPINWSGGDK